LTARRPRAVAALGLVAVLCLTTGLAGCDRDGPTTEPAAFSYGGREELSGTGLCLVYLIAGSAGGGDEVVVDDPSVEVSVTEGCYGSMTPVDVDSLSIEQVWAGNSGDQPDKTVYSHGSRFRQSNSGQSPVVPVSRQDAGHPCMLVTLRIQVQVDGTSDGMSKDLEPCAGAQT
jgi:hypothetical protein